MNDVIINKVQSIRRCIERAKEEYSQAGETFDDDFTRQDAAILNILRACEQVIDLANHIVKNRKLGVPRMTTESFDILAERHIIEKDLCGRLKKMVHFRNIAVHEYQRVAISIVKDVLTDGVDDLNIFADKILELEK